MKLRLPTARQTGIGAFALLALILLGMAYWTAPAPIPPYDTIVTDWHPSESWLYDRDGHLIDSERIDFRARRLGWVPLDRISPALITTIIAAEDHRFYFHEGVDWLSLANALRVRLAGGPMRGASTISMQVAAFLSPELARPGARGWRDKIRQMRAAQKLEDSWSKDQILTAYLNLAPFRGEAQGIGAAALTLLGKEPGTVSRQDALLLAAVLPDPAASAGRIAARACAVGSIADCSGMRLAAETMLSGSRSQMLDPGLAPHLAARLLRKPGQHVHSTLDMATQKMAAIALRRQLQSLGANRARDGAVIVIDNATGDVLAYVGGVGLGSTAAAVDGAGAYRQAGSTLKPFLYAQVIERGWLTAASILDDSPVQLDTASGLYVPKNYDNSFRGPVSVRSALAGSLNVPAVRTLLLDGVQPFRDRLWDLGYHGLSEDGAYYGFSLALGSAEVTLLEQANAYRTLANGGRISPVRMLSDDPHTPGRAIISPQAAWIVADILADPAARTASFGVDSALRLSFWAAAKTGTSKAMRDNWCIGFSSRFTVAVWVGNLEGDSMKSVSGTSGAAPVWRDVMMALHTNQPGKAPMPIAGLEQRRITFHGNVEAPRAEWFLAGTGQAAQMQTPDTARRPRIISPVSGSVYAIDPDIPMDRQKIVANVTGVVGGHRLLLDRQFLSDASSGSAPFMAGPGMHRLALVDPGGRVVDQVRFTVR